jgi:hypothetical protein
MVAIFQKRKNSNTSIHMYHESNFVYKGENVKKKNIRMTTE